MAVGEFLGVTLATVRAMPTEELRLWIEWMNMKNKRGSRAKGGHGMGGGTMGRRERRQLE